MSSPHNCPGVIPSSSPIVVPLRMVKKPRIDLDMEPCDLFNNKSEHYGAPDSPESIHSSDTCSYSSYFERKRREQELGRDTDHSDSSQQEDAFNPSFLTFSGNMTASTQREPTSAQPDADESEEDSEIEHDLPLKLAPRVCVHGNDSVPSSQPPVIPSSQQEPEDIALKRSRPPPLDTADVTIESSDEENSLRDVGETSETQMYFKKYCTGSLLDSLPAPHET